MGFYIQSSYKNLFLTSPVTECKCPQQLELHIYHKAWTINLKTTYYLRTLQASNIEKSTVPAGAGKKPTPPPNKPPAPSKRCGMAKSAKLVSKRPSLG